MCIENSPSFYFKYATLDMCCGVLLNYVAFMEGLFSKSWVKPVDRWTIGESSFLEAIAWPLYA